MLDAAVHEGIRDRARVVRKGLRIQISAFHRLGMRYAAHGKVPEPSEKNPAPGESDFPACAALLFPQGFPLLRPPRSSTEPCWESRLLSAGRELRPPSPGALGLDFFGRKAVAPARLVLIPVEARIRERAVAARGEFARAPLAADDTLEFGPDHKSIFHTL